MEMELPVKRHSEYTVYGPDPFFPNSAVEEEGHVFRAAFYS